VAKQVQQVGCVHIAVHVDVRPADLTLRAVAPVAQENEQILRVDVVVRIEILRAVFGCRKEECAVLVLKRM